jgi:hypothetical protein
MQVNEELLPTRVSLLELQTARLISDVESEKTMRTNENSRFHEELSEIKGEQQKMAKILYMMVGGLVVLQIALQFFKA